MVSKPHYCEIWLSTDGSRYRVAASLPDHVTVPEDFLCAMTQGELGRVCVSTWYDTLKEARERALQLLARLKHHGHQVIFYFEIRIRCVGDLHEVKP